MKRCPKVKFTEYFFSIQKTLKDADGNVVESRIYIKFAIG